MNQKFGVLLLLVIALSTYSCRPFQNQYESIGALCGIDPVSPSAEEFYVKLQSPRGDELTAEMIVNTKARLFHESGPNLPLAISSRGCVRLAAKAGLLQAFNADQNWSLAQAVAKNPDLGLVHVSMQLSPKTSAELQCPEQGLFANTQLSFPLRWLSDGPLQATRVLLTAEEEATRKSHVLYEKPYGDQVIDLPSAIPSKDLPEGSYRLHLSFQTSMTGWDMPGSVPTRVESCALTILHRRPEVGGLDSYPLQDRIAVFAKGQTLPWKSPTPKSELHVCRERRGADLDDTSSSQGTGACAAQGACREAINFQTIGAIVADEAGVFDYYAFAEDRTSNRSPISCQTVVVTDQKPQIELRWAEASWNNPRAQMIKPRANIQLRVLGRHPQLEDASLATSFQCRADFIRRDQSILSGRDIICQNGRCRNKSLENFVPCDAELNLSLLNFLPSLANQEGGVLRLFVRADDRAGHVQEQVASLGIESRRWVPERLSKLADLGNKSETLLQDGQGRIFVDSFWFSIWDSVQDGWVQVPNPTDNSYQGQDFWVSGDKQVYSQWKTYHAKTNEFQFSAYRWDPSGWQEIASLGGEHKQSCRNPRAFHRGGFWCITDNGLAYYQDNQWASFELPDSSLGGKCEISNGILALAIELDKTLWLACPRAIFQRAMGATHWTQVKTREAWDSARVLNLGIDASERLWILRGNGSEDLQIRVKQAGQFSDWPKPERLLAVELLASEFTIGPNSQIILGRSQWSDARQSWVPFSYFDLFGSNEKLHAIFTSKGELYWESEQSLLKWDGQGLIDWDFNMLGLLKDPIGGLQVVTDAADNPWVHAGTLSSRYRFPYRLISSSWFYIAKPNGSPYSYISNFWIDPLGTPSLYIAGEGLYSLQDFGWKLEIESPKVRGLYPLEGRAFEPYLLSESAIYQWKPGQSWTQLASFNEPSEYSGGTKDSKGRNWVYSENKLGVIDQQGFRSEQLDASAGESIRGIFSSGDALLVATESGLLKRTDDQQPWIADPWENWGIASPIDRIRQIDSDYYLLSEKDDSNEIARLWLLDLNTHTKKPFVLPEGNQIGLGQIRRTKQSDFIVAIKFSIYRTDGITIKPIITEKELYKLMQSSGNRMNIFGLEVDDFGRVWFQWGEGLIRIDL